MITFTKIIEREGGYEAVYRLEDGTIVVSFIDVAHELYPDLMEAISNGLSISPEYTNEDLKNMALEQVNVTREEKLNEGFWWDGLFWDSDIISRQNLSGLVTAIAAGLPLPEGFIYRTKQNQNVALNSSQVIALGTAMLTHVNNAYARSFYIKQQIETLDVNDADFKQKLDEIVW